MIRIEMDSSALVQLDQKLSKLPARLVTQVCKALRPMLYDALHWNLVSHFICCVPPRTPPKPDRLTIRSGKLFDSVLDSLQVVTDGEHLTILIGSDVEYAAIHEYGGLISACEAYIPPRPYLRPTMDGMQEDVPWLLDIAIKEVAGR